MALQVALLVIAVAELVGIAVLFTEFSVKFQKVRTSSASAQQLEWQRLLALHLCKLVTLPSALQDQGTKDFSDLSVYIWNISIASVCLVLLSGNLGVFAWRILQANRLHKSWLGR